MNARQKGIRKKRRVHRVERRRAAAEVLGKRPLDPPVYYQRQLSFNDRKYVNWLRRNRLSR